MQETRSDPTAKATRLRLLTIVLRFSGAATFVAFGAVLLPVDWMAAIHEAVGLGEFPRTAVVGYLARTIAALYGFHGALVLLIARDPVRYRPIVTYVATMNIVFGMMLIAIDLHAGMPWFWTLLEGPLIIAVGLAVAFLNRTTPRTRQSPGPAGSSEDQNHEERSKAS